MERGMRGGSAAAAAHGAYRIDYTYLYLLNWLDCPTKESAF